MLYCNPPQSGGTVHREMAKYKVSGVTQICTTDLGSRHVLKGGSSSCYIPSSEKTVGTHLQ